jgi:UPF0755 protein
MKMLNITRKKRLYVLFFLLLIPIFSCLSLLNYAASPLGESHVPHTIAIPKGTSFSRIVDILDEAGLVKHRRLFYLLAFSQHAAGHIRAGEYELASSMTPHAIIKKMVRGEIIEYPVTFPEDWTIKEFAARLASKNLVDEKTFMRLAVDRDFLTSLGIEGSSLEGFLYPDTYRFDRSMDVREIIQIMVSQFWKKVTPKMQDRARELGFTLSEFITLASMIGKESGYSEEKPLIAAVFHNRLKKGMKLQSDPTAVYDLLGSDVTITRNDLLNNNIYNTYRISGLPPGPIANPGIDSLQAALHPAAVKYLFFVSRKDGTHQFSENFAGHNEAISRYQNRKEKE